MHSLLYVEFTNKNVININCFNFCETYILLKLIFWGILYLKEIISYNFIVLSSIQILEILNFAGRRVQSGSILLVKNSPREKTLVLSRCNPS